MKKYFIVSDVHSFYDELIEGLTKAGFDSDNPKHVFVSLGDLLDRGSKPLECLQFVNNLPEDRKILIRGNHENCMLEVFTRGYFKHHDLHNKTNETIIKLYQHFNPDKEVDEHEAIIWMSQYEPYRFYDDSLKNYAVVKDNLFVHGWVPYWCHYLTQLKKTDYFDWYDAVWTNGMYYWHTGLKVRTSNRKGNGLVTVFCGHVHSAYGNLVYHHSGTEENPDYSPFIDDGIVNLDSCTILSNKVNVYTLEV